MTFFLTVFFEPLRNVFFPIWAPKTLPKLRPKSTKIDEKVVSTGLSKNAPHFDDIFLFFLFCVKRPMATKHCKYQYKTMILALPRDAPRFKKNVKQRSTNHPKSFQIGGRRPPKHASEKRPQKKSTKITKMSKLDDFGSPKKQGTNKG